MAIKKYTNGSWVPACRKYGTETDAITTFPATVIGDGTPITSYTIKGNMEQSGTPTPSNPIYPSECGERTENLYDYTTDEQYKYISQNGAIYTAQATAANFVSAKIPVVSGRTYILVKPILVSSSGLYAAFYDSSDNALLTHNVGLNETITLEAPENASYFRTSLKRNGVENMTTMLTEGSTAPTTYIPYGYKLPLTLGSTTTNIYLGEVQSERKIKKLVLDGTEDEVTWGSYINDRGRFIVSPSDMMSGTDRGLVFSDRYNNEYRVPELNINSVENAIAIYEDKIYIYTTGDYTTLASFKTYLAQQYAAGTPVTIWYILAEPTTGIVNEPIRKIGTYTDSVSGTGLATSGTAQQFDVGTTLKPSEVDLTYHGWHEHEDIELTT